MDQGHDETLERVVRPRVPLGGDDTDELARKLRRIPLLGVLNVGNAPPARDVDVLERRVVALEEENKRLRSEVCTLRGRVARLEELAEGARRAHEL